jgi:carboxyl-terminal processing protease
VNYKRDGKERIADSLTRVFYTRDGREVRDGGGIMPDVEVKNDTMSNIAYYLSAGGLDSTEVLFDYVVDYIDRHPAIAPAKDFRLTDEDWQAFRQRVIDSGFSYDPVSKKQFGELVKTAKFEGYYEDAKDAFDALEKKLKHDVATDLDKYRETIQQIIELDIIGAYYYQKGSIEASLNGDKQLKEAVRLLKSPEEYQKILLPKQKK